jgi:hypothetical protein
LLRTLSPLRRNSEFDVPAAKAEDEIGPRRGINDTERLILPEFIFGQTPGNRVFRKTRQKRFAAVLRIGRRHDRRTYEYAATDKHNRLVRPTFAFERGDEDRGGLACFLLR